MKKLSRFEMASHHKAADCRCMGEGYGCQEKHVECNLFRCQVCGAAEAELTTECPRERVPEDKLKQVIAGLVDFWGGQWRSLSWS